MYPQKNGFTWCDANDCPKSRINYIFISKDLIDFTKNIILKKILGTHDRETRMNDHTYIKTSVIMNKLERGSGYWELNVSSGTT